jgi:putative N6-adenine-specific DNA methylase
MLKYTIIATSTFGLESVLAYELKLLGYSGLVTENGRVSFNGDERDIARCNIWLRVADRVLIEIAKFRATDFEELFQGTLKIKWENIIPLKGKMHVVGKSIKSKLFSVKDCQAIVKKAVVEAMKRKYRILHFEESGPVYKIEVALLKDIATLTIDTTGPGLHKRGYREGTGEAPLRETLAAGLVMLSRWNPATIFADPFCGSGTIPIEAALIGKNIAPGLKRTFVSEDWSQIPKKVWDEERRDASAQVKNPDFRILASDMDGYILKKARINAQNAGVADCIAFQKLPVSEFRSGKKYGYLICNPPYGERVGDEKEVEGIYRAMGEAFQRLDSWSFFILTAHTEFERFFGKKADNNRKLFNGNIRCYYYQYHAK